MMNYNLFHVKCDKQLYESSQFLGFKYGYNSVQMSKNSRVLLHSRIVSASVLLLAMHQPCYYLTVLPQAVKRKKLNENYRHLLVISFN